MTEYPDGWLTNLSKYIAGLNTELVGIKVENAELLRELGLMRHMYAKVSEEKCSTDDENAKLRELVTHMYTCIQHFEHHGCNTFRCETCPMNNNTQHCDFEERMHKLGIET